jgi:hypothetical protein
MRMPRRQRADSPVRAQIVGGPERFDAFFDREARRALAVALLASGDWVAADTATRRAFERARRDWAEVGLDPDRGLLVRRWAVDRAWPSRRQRRVLGRREGGDVLDRFRRVVVRLPRRRARAAVLAVADDPDGLERVLGDGAAAMGLADAVHSRLAEMAGDPEVMVAHLRPAVPEPGYRSRRAAPFIGVAAAAVAAISVLTVASPKPDQEATATTSTEATTTRIVSSEWPWWSVTGWFGDEPEVTLAGWEALGSVPTPGGSRVATAWTGRELFLSTVEPSESGPPFLDGRTVVFLYDPATGSWRDAAPPPDDVCSLGYITTTPVRDGVVVTGFGAGRRCMDPYAYLYSPGADTWTDLDHPFLAMWDGVSHLLWTGDLLVSPVDGAALHWDSGEVVALPPLPVAEPARPGVPGTLAAHWTGERVLIVGTNGIHAWTPGDDGWETLDAAPYLHESASSAWTTEGLLVLDPDEGARFHDGDSWRPAHGLFWGGWCWAAVVRVSVPMVQTCGGHFVWDGKVERWVPFPLSNLQFDYALVDVDGDVYSIGPTLRRLLIDHDVDGSIVPPSTVPIGSVYVEIPAGFAYVEHFGPDRRPLGLRSGVTWTLGAVISDLDGDVRCEVAVTHWHSGRPDTWLSELSVLGPRVVARPGVGDLSAEAVSGEAGSVGVAFSGGLGGFWLDRGVLITCDAVEAAAAEEAAMRLASGMWSPAEAYHFETVDLGGADPIVWQVTDVDGTHEAVFPYRAIPDRARSEAAMTGFADCVADTMGGAGVVLGSLRLLVDADGELIEVSYSVVRPDLSPPVGHLPDRARILCLRVAGVAETFIAKPQPGP